MPIPKVIPPVVPDQPTPTRESLIRKRPRFSQPKLSIPRILRGGRKRKRR